jgi:hypothetical protein
MGKPEKNEAAARLYTYEVIATPDTSSEESETPAPQGNCAWCGDPPDVYGSHGICAFHAAQMSEQSHRRRSRGRS